MRKGNNTINKPICAYDTGTVMPYTVQDLIIDRPSNKLLGFLVDEGNWLGNTLVLSWDSIKSIGEDIVVASSSESIVPAEKFTAIHNVLERDITLNGSRIMTTGGKDLGTISDLYFHPETGIIEGYEVMGGIFANSYSGLSFVPASQILKIGEDVAFVSPRTVDMMVEQFDRVEVNADRVTLTINNTSQLTQNNSQTTKQIVPKKLNETKSFVKITPLNTGEKKAFVLGKVVQKNVIAISGEIVIRSGQIINPSHVKLAERQGVLDKLYKAAGGILQQVIPEKLNTLNKVEQKLSNIQCHKNSSLPGCDIEKTRGYRVNHTIRGKEGLIIAAVGQIVTESVIQRAYKYEGEQALLEAVDFSNGGSVSTQLKPATGLIGEQLREGVELVTAGAKYLWHKMKEKVSNNYEIETQVNQQEQIRDALGRPVTRVIMDQENNVILNIGDLINHKAIKEARQAGVLDTLLASAYQKTKLI